MTARDPGVNRPGPNGPGRVTDGDPAARAAPGRDRGGNGDAPWVIPVSVYAGSSPLASVGASGRYLSPIRNANPMMPRTPRA